MPATTHASIEFISAGAGSGKTHTLSQTLADLLIQKKARPSGVIATTFTRKAAAELRERVRETLIKKGQFTLAQQIGQACIGTVNSVCGDLLKRFSFEAGLSPNQQVLDDVAAKAFLNRIADEQLDTSNEQEFMACIQRMTLHDDWKKNVQRVIELSRANDIPREALATMAARNAEEFLSCLSDYKDEDLNQRLIKAIDAAIPPLKTAIDLKWAKNTADYLALIEGIRESLKDNETPWSEWIKLGKAMPGDKLKKNAEPVQDLAKLGLGHPQLRCDVQRYLEKIFALASEVLGHYEQQKRELGMVDFTDQEHLVHSLLDNPVVQEVLDEELDVLLVDEFQDTSPLQLAIFLKLIRHARHVYWVGDIKQAIFGFRGSDLRLMQGVLKQLPLMDGKTTTLGQSWRSRAELVHLANEIFVEAFGETIPAEQITLEPTRESSGSTPVMNWMLEGGKLAEQHCAMAGGVRKLVSSGYVIHDKDTKTDRPVRYGDIAILCTQNDRITELADAFRSQGIPTATTQPGLLATPEATLALACLRRLADRTNTVATAEIVSMIEGQSLDRWLADRLRYLEDGGDPDAWHEATHSSHERQHDPHPEIHTIAALRAELPLLSPAEALRRVVARCRIAHHVVRWSKDVDVNQTRLANLDSLLELATTYEEQCQSAFKAATIAGLLSWLGELQAAGNDSLAMPAIDAVNVLTHHRAKGLEWPVVILWDLSDSIKDSFWDITAQSMGDLDTSNPLKDRFLRFWPWPFARQEKFQWAENMSNTPEALKFRLEAIEERKRLLYVSMTRARDLMILARAAKKPSGPWLDSVNAPWLLASESTADITLPKENQRITVERWELGTGGSPLEEKTTCKSEINWFQTSASNATNTSLFVSPSQMTAPALGIQSKQRISSKRLVIAPGTDMEMLGKALHGCLALEFADQRCLVTMEEIQSLLSGYGVATSVDSTAVMEQLKAFRSWVDTRWPGAVAYAEYPVEQLLENGQVLKGRIDLLIRHGDEVIVIDHKSNPGGADRHDTLVEKHSGQLSAYRKALQENGLKVRELWLFLVVTGEAISVC